MEETLRRAFSITGCGLTLDFARDRLFCWKDLLFWVGLLAFGISCAGQSASSLDGPASKVRASRDARRFAILPLNSMQPAAPELLVAKDRMLGQIAAYLKVQRRDRRTITEDQTKALWRVSTAEVHASGSPRNFESAIRVFAPKLAEIEPFDALVVPSLVYRSARLIRNKAKWDEVVRPINADVHSPDVNVRVDTIPPGYRGFVKAVSLHVMVFSPTGEKLFDNFGGIDVVHDFTLDRAGEIQAKFREKVLESYRYMREGVELAFEPYFSRPDNSDW